MLRIIICTKFFGGLVFLLQNFGYLNLENLKWSNLGS